MTLTGEPPTGPFDEEMVQARKAYACVECGGEIVYGEEHWRAKGVWDGKWATYRTCEECFEFRQELLAAFSPRDDELPAFGHLYDYGREYGIEREGE